LRLASRVLLLQLAVMTLTWVIAFVLFAMFNRERLDIDYGLRALDIARIVASNPTVVTNIPRYEDVSLNPSPAQLDELANGPLQRVATRVQQRTHVLFVVIANTHGVRLAYPDRAELGLRVTTDPTLVLAGHEDTLHESGALGRSTVGRVPILEPGSNRVLGLVSVGTSTQERHEKFVRNLHVLAVLGGVALLIGIVGSVALARRWRRLTLGLKPAEMAELVRGQAAVLQGIGEGVLATDTSWNTTFVNDEVTVVDSGDGVAPDFVEQLFTEGTTTKPDSGIPGGRGIGLALSRQISRSLDGDLWLSSPGNPDPESGLRGAEFIARLPGVMAEEAQWATQT
jgi:two-component system CitB family sensor kinase